MRKVVVLTSSYPRDDGDFAGRFVADAVAQLRARGLEVEVVHPELRADGGGLVRTLRRRPWLAPVRGLPAQSSRVACGIEAPGRLEEPATDRDTAIRAELRRWRPSNP